MSALSELAEKQNAILRRRAAEATRAVMWSIGSAEVMFAAFAIGSALGPHPLSPVEILLGSTAFFLTGAATSYWLAKKRQNRGARFSARVHEGRKELRVVLFDDHLMLGGEVVLKEAIATVELEERAVVLRYKDALLEGMVLRELTSERAVLETLHQNLGQLGLAVGAAGSGGGVGAAAPGL